MNPLYVYRKSEGCRFGAVFGICAMFLLASWYLTEHPNLTFWPVTALCFGLGAAGFIGGGIVGALISPPPKPANSEGVGDSKGPG
jgi:hypothetical protein